MTSLGLWDKAQTPLKRFLPSSISFQSNMLLQHSHTSSLTTPWLLIFPVRASLLSLWWNLVPSAKTSGAIFFVKCLMSHAHDIKLLSSLACPVFYLHFSKDIKEIHIVVPPRQLFIYFIKFDLPFVVLKPFEVLIKVRVWYGAYDLLDPCCPVFITRHLDLWQKAATAWRLCQIYSTWSPAFLKNHL